MQEKPVAVGSAGRELASNASVPHAEATADFRADGARGLRRRELEPSECVRWDCDVEAQSTKAEALGDIVEAAMRLLEHPPANKHYRIGYPGYRNPFDFVVQKFDVWILIVKVG